MRITITASTANARPFELCKQDGGTRGVGSAVCQDGLSISEERGVEKIEALRATNAQFIDRGNASVSISFTVSREHASVEAAQGYMLFHASNVPHSGRVEFEEWQNRGRAWIYGAVLTVGSSIQRGVSTEHQYTIQGGAFSKVSPPMTSYA